MIDFKHAMSAFKKYLQNFDSQYGKIDLKIRHTYGLVKASEYIANKLNISSEDIELAILIALLHDLGRFEQIRKSNSFIDNKDMDHAVLGNDILFKNNLIRDFIEDSIILLPSMLQKKKQAADIKRAQVNRTTRQQQAEAMKEAEIAEA